MREIREISIEEIQPNPYQPRESFDDDNILELAESIKSNGLLQPIVVRQGIDCYEIIAGERRFRAVKRAGLNKVNCIVMDASETETAQLALIENVQRENLNAIEEAKAYVKLMRLTGKTQQEMAQQVGKKQSTIANKIRLLSLGDEVQQEVMKRKITERHARAMLGLNHEQQKQVLNEILNNNLTVAQTENKVAETFKAKPKKFKTKLKGFSHNIQIAINTLKQAISLIEKTGIVVNSQQEETENEIIMTIHIKK